MNHSTLALANNVLSDYGQTIHDLQSRLLAICCKFQIVNIGQNKCGFTLSSWRVRSFFGNCHCVWLVLILNCSIATQVHNLVLIIYWLHLAAYSGINRLACCLNALTRAFSFTDVDFLYHNLIGWLVSSSLCRCLNLNTLLTAEYNWAASGGLNESTVRSELK